MKDPQLAEDMRGFIGQEATHADVHEQMLHEYMVVNGIDPKPMLEQIEFLFSKMLAPTTSTDPKRRLNHLCDRLWFIAAIEHYTAVMGDFALNCAWDDYGADPTMVDLFRWHGSEEVEHRSVAHDVAVYFHDSYVDRVRAMMMAVVAIFVFFQRTSWFLVKSDPNTDIGWWRFNRLRMRGLEARATSQVPQAVRFEHRDVLPARLHAGRDGFDGAGGGLPRQFPRCPRGTHLMGLLDRYRQAPPSISGRRRHDIVLGIADTSVSALWAISGAIRKMKPPPEPDRVIALTVVDRQVVAHDQDVVALTLAAADGRPLPRWHPGAHLDIAAAERPAAPVLAVRRPRRHRHLPDRGAPDRRRRRRIDRGARRAAGRRAG